jgi:hypothetical protein
VSAISRHLIKLALAMAGAAGLAPAAAASTHWASTHTRAPGTRVLRLLLALNKANPATVESGPLGPNYIPAANPVAVKGFRDITLGTKGGCVARAGYDYCTGIGSLQSAALSGAL